jgi:hypothetical protein
MKKNMIILAGTIVLMIVESAMATKPLDDYSFIRGVCYSGGCRNDQATLERDLGYAKRLQLNSTRIWINEGAYRRNPEGFIESLRNYIRTSHKLGISTMPILFNGNGLNPSILQPDYRTRGDEYVKAVVEALKDEEGLLMWDIMNEPTCNDYCLKSPEDELAARHEQIKDFLHHYCTYIKELDPVNAITVGHMYPRFLELSADVVDVLSFHDYLETRQRVENSYIEAEAISKKYDNKPLLNSEMACLGRSNPYDMAIEICESHKVGWYVFDLMIGGYWGDVHGLVYPDGTIRDPSIIAALFGFYRNRDLNTSIKPNPNKEGRVNEVLQLLKNVLTDETEVFRSRRSSTDDILEVAEYCANMLECCEMVPMYDSPLARIQTWRAQPPSERDELAIRKFAYELGLLLKKYCNIL